MIIPPLLVCNNIGAEYLNHIVQIFFFKLTLSNEQIFLSASYLWEKF